MGTGGGEVKAGERHHHIVSLSVTRSPSSATSRVQAERALSLGNTVQAVVLQA